MKRSLILSTSYLCLGFTHLVAQTETPTAPTPKVDPSSPSQEQPTAPATDLDPEKKEIPKAVVIEDEPFIPAGGIAQLKEQADIDLFTKGKNIGHVQDNPKQKYRRLVQRTIMPTEPLSSAGAVLTFDDYLVADSSKMGSAMDIAKDFAKLNARAIFFANVNGVSGTDVSRVLRKKISNTKKKELIQKLLDSKKKEFVQTIRDLIKIKGPADKDGNREFTCEVFNHTAFHQDMSRFKVGSIRFEIALIGIDFIEQCIDEAYAAERPNWKRARYFRFPFLHAPRDKAAKAELNKKFTELGLISVGETQDSKDFINYSSRTAYRSLTAAKKKRRYNPKYGRYGTAEKPIALFHTKTWKKIRLGVLKAIKEK